jgi:glycosyltransferase involved in cell wall biosynthesis
MRILQGGINIDNVVADLGLAKHVRLLGYVDESTLATLYSNALFLAMPSLYEGFGLPLVEAMIHGTPVLTSSNSSMPEVAGDAGFLVDALDIGSIENGLHKLIGDKAIRDKLASNTKKNAARFNWDQSARQLVSVFEKVTGNRN